jgi:hypothetical protein
MIGYFDAIDKLKAFSDKHLHSLSCMCEPPAAKGGAGPSGTLSPEQMRRGMMTL